jgi:2-aminoadipate transaminase
MPEQSPSTATLPHLAPSDFLNDAARSLGAGIASAGGWAPAASGALPPIAMAGGIPDPGTLPREELLAAMRVVLERSAPEALRYGGTRGFDGLRAALAERSQAQDRVSQSAENFLLTNGSSAAIDLICRTFINPGDVIVAESPSYSGSLHTLRGNQARLEPVRMDADGIVPADLEAVLSRLRSAGTPAKLIYSVPDFHNPTGANLSLPRRREVIEIAARHGALIVEDDAYCEIYFDDQPLPSLYSLAGGEGVLRVGTFSKTIATGLRVGWLQGRADFVAACDQMRFDMGGSPLVHRMLAEYVGSGRWETHMAAMRRLYAQKCAALSDAIRDECEAYVRFQRPAGGFFLWLECAGGVDAGRAVKAAAEEGLVCVPGGSFFLGDTDTRHIRLAFSTAPVAEMPEAARRLRRAFARTAD